MVDFVNPIKNLIGSELERKGIKGGSPAVSQRLGVSVAAVVDQEEDGAGAPLPDDDNFYSTEPPPPSEENEGESETDPVGRAPLDTPDSATFIVEQTLIQPTISSDVASVSVIISLDDIVGASDYEVRWVTV